MRHFHRMTAKRQGATDSAAAAAGSSVRVALHHNLHGRLRCPWHPPARRSGFAYLLALSVVLVMTLVTLVLCRGVGQHLRAQNNAAARAQCEQAALGMIRAVAHDLEAARQLGGAPALATVLPEGERIGNCIVMLIGRDPLAAKSVFGLIPQAAKMNVNTATLEQLAALPGMDVALASAITDWRDEDDDTNEQGGGERNDYAGEPVPYAPRNAPLESLDELRLVRGITGALYFGEDANQNGVLDPGEDTDGDGKLTPGLRDLLTLDSREPALAPDGSARVDVRDLGRNMRTLLLDRLGSERGTAVLTAATLARQKRPFANRLDFLSALELTEDETVKLWPYLAGPEGRVGLIDAWSCREEVLAAAVGDTLAKIIVVARPLAAPASPAWLTEALGREDCAKIGMLLTSGSYQFDLDVLAVRTDGAGYARLRATLTLSGTAARVSAIRPAQTQGWPLPWITPDQLRNSPPGSDPLALLSTPPR